MAGEVRRIVLIPRYTGFYGAMTFYSAPIQVRDFAKVVVTVWRSAGLGSTQADLDFHLEQSDDLENWVTAGLALDPSAGSEESAEIDIDHAWLRVAVTCSGNSPGASGWAVGDFVPRDPGKE